MAKIVAQNGPDTFLVDVGGGKGRILDRGQGVYFAPWNIESILARGYWEPYQGSQDVLVNLLADVRDDITVEP